MLPARMNAINVMCVVKRHKLKNVKLVKDVVEQIMRQILVVTVATREHSVIHVIMVKNALLAMDRL